MSKFNSTLIRQVTTSSKNFIARFTFSTLLVLVVAMNVSVAQTLTQTGFTSVITPQYMGSGDATRLPVMFRATVTGLTANTTYRYFVQAAISTDLGGTNPGAGNPLMINAAGTTYKFTTSPSLSSASGYETFTTDGSGNYTGWFGFVNSGNARFTAGNTIFPTISISSNTSSTVLHRRALSEGIKVLTYSTSAGVNNGSFIRESGSSATEKNLALIYDNTDGTGRPLSIAPIESIGVTIASLISGYSTAAGSWNAVMPNTNANGVRRIEQRSVTTASIVGCATDADGVWPTGSVNTVNPNSGTTASVISATDAPLNTCAPICPTITVTATPSGTILCNGGTVDVTVSAVGGTAPYSGAVTHFGVSAGTYTYTVTDANGCTGSTSITITQPALLVATAEYTPIVCPGDSSTVTVSVTGGVAPYVINGDIRVVAGSHSYNIVDANSCITSVTINVVQTPDNTNPTITAPASVTVNANAACNASGIDLGIPVTSDNCTVASVANNAPASFPLGNTTVTWTVTDGSGNTATATQTVTVADTTKPVIYFINNNLLAGVTGNSTTQTPYLKPAKPGIKFTSVFSVNDVAGGYRMAGLADGLGALDNNDGTFTVLIGHEINNTLGVNRAHGSKGAFVSKWIINKSDLSVVSGSDLMQRVYLWNTATNTFNLGTFAFSRFCSADLPPVSAFYNSATGLGTRERIFMNGEESGTEGKGVGHIVTGADAGSSYELPWLGKFAWENSVASPAPGNKTIVGGTDDGTGGQVYFYIGTKTNTGTDIDKAGLNNGRLFGVKVTGLAAEVNGSTPAPGTRFEMADLGFVQNKTGAVLNAESIAAGVTTFFRPEDAAWDPSNPNDFYFVTTNAFNSPTRLWRLRFDNIATPETGGTIEAVLNGTEGGQMFDNIGIDKAGHLLITEDPGNNAYIGKVWDYNIATDVLSNIAYHDSSRFINGAPNFLTQDEESSGVIDVSEILGPGMSLVDVQGHYTPATNGTEVVEGGQLLAMFNPYQLGASTAADTVKAYITSGCTATIDLGIPATGDNCTVASVTNNAPASFPIGTTVVTWTVTDGSGNITTANQIVIVADTTKPTITAPAAITLNTNEGCTSTNANLGTATVSDNCGVIITNNAPYALPLGTTIVTWTVTDSSGNSDTATQSVTVVDNVNPVIYLTGTQLLAGVTGISTTQTPYLRPNLPGTKYTSILSVNDVAGGYRMAGLADGLGAFDNNDGTFTVLIGHEIGNTLGITRAHGSKGAFVSKWIINKSDLSVVSGSDLMQRLYRWNTTTNSYELGTFAFSRFCSADLPAASAFYNHLTGKGTKERIFMNGEESGTEGKGVGHIVTGADAGSSYELPWLGKFAWENSMASPFLSDKTIVAGTDDGTGGQVYFYIGTKTNTGTDIDKAGLNNGRLYGVKVAGLTVEVNGSTPAPGTRFDLADLGEVQNKTGATLNTESLAAGVTTFLRPEDGAWDPSNPNDFYFVTTNGFNNPTRLWRLRFDNIATPETGGTIEAVLNGTEGAQMFDNIGIDKAGHVLITEDPGNNAYLGKVWQYIIATDSLFKIGQHDSTRFLVGGANFLTQDEESSGVIDVSEILGPGMLLVDVQGHYTPSSNATEVVEGGQLLAVFNPYQLGASTAKDTIRVQISSGTSTTVDLGIPATGDNCSVASVTNNAPAQFPIGTTIVTWTVTDGSGNTATVNQVVIVEVAANQLPIVNITNPTNGATYPAGSSITMNVNATDPDGSIVKVEFFEGSDKLGLDSTAPYSFTGIDVEAGSYVLTARAFDNRGDSTISDTVRITVIACEGTGTISAEGYTGIPGNLLINLSSDIDYPNNPDVVTTLDKFEYGPNLDDNYGGRVRGYICAPLTGNYVFYISSDEQSELWLSTDESPSNIRRIAYVETRVPFRSYFGTLQQRSVAIKLIKGARYYIESVHKEGTGADHLSVSWRMPNGVLEGPIPGSRLSPYLVTPPASIVNGGSPAPDFGTALRASTAQVQQDNVKKLEVLATPNPSTGYFTIRTRSNSNQPLIITMTDVLGRVVEKKEKVAANGTVQMGSKLLTGVYFVEVVQGTQKERVKLIRQ